MKRTCILVPVLLVMTLIISCGETQRVIVEARSVEEAMSLAAEDGSLAVVYFWRDG